jgi:hypothetical protein
MTGRSSAASSARDDVVPLQFDVQERQHLPDDLLEAEPGQLWLGFPGERPQTRLARRMPGLCKKAVDMARGLSESPIASIAIPNIGLTTSNLSLDLAGCEEVAGQ